MPAPSMLSHDDRSTILNVQPKPKHVGLVLVKDTHNNDASFLRIINLSPSGKSVLWEQELYRGFEFTRHAPFFFTVVGDEYVFGLDFADADEATKFEEKVKKRARKIMKQQQQQRVSVSNGPSATQRSLNLDDEKYRKLVKALAAYNITESMLDDPNTAKLIKDFVNQNGTRAVSAVSASNAPVLGTAVSASANGSTRTASNGSTNGSTRTATNGSTNGSTRTTPNGSTDSTTRTASNGSARTSTNGPTNGPTNGSPWSAISGTSASTVSAAICANGYAFYGWRFPKQSVGVDSGSWRNRCTA
ncbi:hypothetical protein GGI15_001185 [Coemansia interrupta]|uniref:WH1 domain-containing protein n=1 Tax=Coemansia interrupta TaxID=1126814 RepID=A0A9W8HPR6_9FUNG|nr:hypothetical protein GGI15_001185 [Coemansia interrupta]